MAFTQWSDDLNNHVPPVIELPSTASEVYTVGEALVVNTTTGALTMTAADARPDYICMEEYTAPASGNRNIRVVRINPTTIYKTTFAADASANKEGTLVTIHTDGAQVTATASNGDALIVKKFGTGASGTEVLVRFPYVS
jgi:hypothetical protein